MNAVAEIRDIKLYMREVGEQARAAARVLARADSATKDRALAAAAAAIRRDAAKLLAANAEDVAEARAGGLAPALLDRLELTAAGVEDMAEGLEQIARLPDPVGAITDLRERPSGIRVGRMRVPLGVIGIIYESRPNVTADAAGLCLKSGNAAILRGGSEALRCNRAIAACMHEGLAAAGLPQTAIQVIATTDRAAVGELLTMNQYVDIIVPRGGKGLIERVMKESRIPMIKHLDGVCHVYIDDRADLRQGDTHRRQRQDPALRHLQHHGDAAGGRGHRRQGAAAAGEDLSRQGRGAARRRAIAQARARDQAGERSRTGTRNISRRFSRSAW